MTFERPYIQQLISRMKEPRAFIQVLMGSRQVGKSSLIWQVLVKLKTPHLFVSSRRMATNILESRIVLKSIFNTVVFYKEIMLNIKIV